MIIFILFGRWRDRKAKTERYLTYAVKLPKFPLGQVKAKSPEFTLGLQGEWQGPMYVSS